MGDIEAAIHPKAPTKPAPDEAGNPVDPGQDIPVGTMPPIFKGFEDDRYQKHDILITVLVAEFNRRKQELVDCTDEQLEGIPDLDAALIKAWMIQEAGGGDARSRAAWEVDPLQVNVPGDWGDEKQSLGLTKPSQRNEGTIEGNLWAALGYLARKGFSPSAKPPRDRGTHFDPQDPKDRTGDSRDWREALKRYNGRRVKTANGKEYRENYADQILERARNPGKHVPIELPKPQ